MVEVGALVEVLPVAARKETRCALSWVGAITFGFEKVLFVNDRIIGQYPDGFQSYTVDRFVFGTRHGK